MVQPRLGFNEKWYARFMAIANHLATWSKDTSRGVGCVIVGPNREILTTGYNGFPRGVNDTIPERFERPAKYKWTEHAERNAIFNAARNGIRLDGAIAFIPWYPCADCARALIQCGISEMICYEPNFEDPKWGEDFRIVYTMMNEAAVFVTYLKQEEASAAGA
jgi:dCMP deaminase